MKALFVAYNQAYYMEIVQILQDNSCKGFTLWNSISGQGSVSGEPHLGSHAWPTQNDALLAFVDDDKVDTLLSQIKARDEATPDLGLRAFVWGIDKFC